MKNKKIFTYCNGSNYVICSCEISDVSITNFRRNLKEGMKGSLGENKPKVSIELLHKFDSMLGADIIDLGVIADDLLSDNLELATEITTNFLDILEIKERKNVDLEEFSQGLRYAQTGSFGTNVENNRCLKEYESSMKNNIVINTIGYDLDARLNKKSKSVKEKTKIIAFSA